MLFSKLCEFFNVNTLAKGEPLEIMRDTYMGLLALRKLESYGC